MATGSESRGTKKGSKGKFRTPKLSDAQKRSNKLNRALKPPKGAKTIIEKGAKDTKITFSSFGFKAKISNKSPVPF